eukprot:4232547-Heterocapsa_arctica.AAC.1
MASCKPRNDEQQLDTKRQIADETATLRLGGLYRFFAYAPAHSFYGPKLQPAAYMPMQEVEPPMAVALAGDPMEARVPRPILLQIYYVLH